MDPKENQARQHEASAQRAAEREAAARRGEQGEEPWSEEQPGIVAVVDAVRDQEFPTTLDRLAERVGERRVPTQKDVTLPMRDVLGKLKEDEFQSVRDFQRAVHRHWEGIRFLAVPDEQRPAGGGPQPQQRGD